MSNDELKERPGLCLAKTHPWLKWRKGAYNVFQETANLVQWLNQNDTKEALNVDPSRRWHDCDNDMYASWGWMQEASQWIYTVLKTSGYIRMGFYSGDTDGVLPTIGSRKWIEELGWEKTGPW